MFSDFIPAHPVRPERADNPLYPLPAHYADLTPADQRIARLNAISLQETPDDLVDAWSFFRAYYLRNPKLPPNFFYKRFRKSPPFHYQMIRDVGQHQLNAVAAPRGASKSTVLVAELPLLLLLTRSNFNILLVLSSDTMVSKRMQGQIGRQLIHNPIIREDFGLLKPKRGQTQWSGHAIQLLNGSMVEAVSVRGGMLGQRPDLILIDDPEYDPALQRMTSELVDNYQRLLMDVIYPMLDRGGSSLYWIGTLLSKQCFLYHVITTLSDDRFSYWNRRLLDAEDDGHGNLLWPEKWSESTLEEEKSRMGLAAYNAARRNRPGVRADYALKLDAQTNFYTLSCEFDDPFETHAVLSTHKINRTPGIAQSNPKSSFNILPRELHERPLVDCFPRWTRVVTVDWARCLTPTSDYVAILVAAVENSADYPDTWWILDLVVERMRDEAWIKAVWSLAQRWRARLVGVEAVGAQDALAASMSLYLDHNIPVESWRPSVVPIRYRDGLTKEDRIAALAGRFRAGRVRLPAHLRSRWPWSELFHEIECFTGFPGATRHDDPLDALAMLPYLVGNRRAFQLRGDAANPRARVFDPAAALARGETHWHTLFGDIPVGCALDPSVLSPDLIASAVNFDDYADRPDAPGIFTHGKPRASGRFDRRHLSP